MSDDEQRGIWGDPPNRFEPPEHQLPDEVDDAATRRVEKFNEAQSRDTVEEERWSAIHRDHLEQLDRLEAEGRRAAEGGEPKTWTPPRQGSGSDASHRRAIPPGGREVGGQNRPPRTDPRGWDNRRDDPNREEDFYPPDEVPRHQPPGRGVPPAPIDLGPAVGRRVGDPKPESAMGSKPILPASAPDPIGQVEKQVRRQDPKSRKPAGRSTKPKPSEGEKLTSAEGLAAAVQGAKSQIEGEVAGRLAETSVTVEDMAALISRLDGGKNAPSLMLAIQFLQSIREDLGNDMAKLQGAMNALDTYAAGVGNT